MVELTNQSSTDSLFSNDPLLSFSNNQPDQISNFFTNNSSILLGNSTPSSRATNNINLLNSSPSVLTTTNKLGSNGSNTLSKDNIVVISATPYIGNQNSPILLSYSLQISAASTTGVTYYISPTGNDKNSGTSPTQAWKTISKINGKTFNPGDQILFQGGATFAGNLSFDVNDKGTATNPITISSYGTGKAIINAGTGQGISVYNSGGYGISNLNIVGSGTATNTASGIDFYTDLANNTKLEYININNVDVSGFKDSGIKIGGWNQGTGYRNVSVTNTATHDNGRHGLITYAQLNNTNENVYIGYVRAYNNFGIAGESNPSGNGIVLGEVNQGKIEYSLAYDNGKLDNLGFGPAGIWTYDSNGITIQYNESYNNRTGGGVDGDGFDLDQNVSNSIMQYNYSHGNDGAGFLLCQAPDNLNHTGNTVRYNISENDGRKNGYGAIDVYGKVRNTDIYNNTIFLSAASTGSPSAIRVWNAGAETLDVSNLSIRNNIFQTVNGQPLVTVSASQLAGATGLLFQGNNYFSSGQAFNIKWGGTTYNSLTNWQNGTQQEKLASQNVGKTFDPLLLNPGGGGTIGNPSNLNLLNAYKLGSSSPLINAGLNLNSLFGINVGSQDFYGSTLPQGLGYDIGAHEWR